MKIKITRRVILSKLHEKYDIHYYRIILRHGGKQIYERLLNPIYDLNEFLLNLQETYHFEMPTNASSSHDRTTPEKFDTSYLLVSANIDQSE